MNISNSCHSLRENLNLSANDYKSTNCKLLTGLGLEFSLACRQCMCVATSPSCCETQLFNGFREKSSHLAVIPMSFRAAELEY